MNNSERMPAQDWSPAQDGQAASGGKIVLQKFIADSGLCSRRQAEELIKKTEEPHCYVSPKDVPVLVNGQPAELGMRVDENDEVVVNGKKIGLIKEHIYIILNKPKGYVCTNRTFKNERNIFELVRVPVRLFAVGRLDKNSRGLVLLTNDGELTEKLTHPRYAHEKEYEIQIEKGVLTSAEILSKFKQGIDIGEDVRMIKVKKIICVREGMFRIILTEGRKRQIRRMFGELDCKVFDLKRVRIGNLKLGNLKEGAWRKLSNQEINNLS
jgi:pseudouridine synthase